MNTNDLRVSGQSIVAFDKYRVNHWRGQLEKVAPEVEKVSRDAAQAVKQFGTNSKLVIENIYGKACLIFLIYPKSFHLWNYRTGSSIGDYADIPSNLDEIIDQVTAGLHLCNACGTWCDDKDARYYSFAGIVCAKCYDPKKHLPPDTSGD